MAVLRHRAERHLQAPRQLLSGPSLPIWWCPSADRCTIGPAAGGVEAAVMKGEQLFCWLLCLMLIIDWGVAPEHRGTRSATCNRSQQLQSCSRCQQLQWLNLTSNMLQLQKTCQVCFPHDAWHQVCRQRGRGKPYMLTLDRINDNKTMIAISASPIQFGGTCLPYTL